jgi:pilus assembly protein CpaC
MSILIPWPAFADGTSLRLDDPGRIHRLILTLNKSKTLRVDRPVQEWKLVNQDVADVEPLTDQSVYIIGKKIGLTRLTLLDGKKQLLGVVEVEVSYDKDELEAELKQSVPGGEFRIRTANGRLLLGGSVPDALALAKAVDITEQFTKGCAAQELKELADAAGNQPPPAQPGFSVQLSSQSAKTSGPPPKCFVNSLSVRAPQQVLLEVRFVEAQRSAARDLGFAWDAQSNRFRGVANAQLNPFLSGPNAGSALLSSFASNAVPFGTFIARVLDDGTTADLVIQALEKRGLARRLAEPNLVTLSGDTASFLAGGEFPIPVAQSGTGNGLAIITLEFKKFGIGLAFTPTVLADSQINLKIEPEVSDIDPSQNFSLGAGITVPGLVVRRASTTVELRDGQSFAVAGLLQTKHIKEDRQLPWVGNVPVLGALFRSASYEKEESDLVIIVTPHLVRPAAPGQKLATPLDRTVASNDRDYFLRGEHEIPKNDSWSSSTIKEPGTPATPAGNPHTVVFNPRTLWEKLSEQKR